MVITAEGDSYLNGVTIKWTYCQVNIAGHGLSITKSLMSIILLENILSKLTLSGLVSTIAIRLEYMDITLYH